MECNDRGMAEDSRTSTWADKRTPRHSETWWWNEVAKANEEKRIYYET